MLLLPCAENLQNREQRIVFIDTEQWRIMRECWRSRINHILASDLLPIRRIRCRLGRIQSVPKAELIPLLDTFPILLQIFFKKNKNESEMLVVVIKREFECYQFQWKRIEDSNAFQ
ncbi:hypothetical protein RB195_018959 [Necator americanus]|uniref:Uncharacterized protein n=1 Tax=Necator americanus TaxID=51031 RepID=A0ABR1CD18_NECAM